MFRSVPQITNDCFHEWGNDLILSSSGDLQPVNGSAKGEQRVLRRLLTAIGGYLWHTDYGAGVPAYVGQPISQDLFEKIKSTIKSQIFLEEAVSQNPQPNIFIQTIQAGIYCQINYTDAPTKIPVVLTFDING